MAGSLDGLTDHEAVAIGEQGQDQRRHEPRRNAEVRETDGHRPAQLRIAGPHQRRQGREGAPRRTTEAAHEGDRLGSLLAVPLTAWGSAKVRQQERHCRRTDLIDLRDGVSTRGLPSVGGHGFDEALVGYDRSSHKA